MPGYKFITALCPNLKPTWSEYRCQGKNWEVVPTIVLVGGNLSPKSVSIGEFGYSSQYLIIQLTRQVT